jgi:O-antigen/teichoic acid export membrane protein
MLLRATLRYLPAQVLAPLAQLVSMVAWTHWLAPVEMGTFTLVTTTQELAYLACLSWFSVHALRTLPGAESDHAARRPYLETENVVVLGACLALALAAMLLAMTLPGADTWQGTAAIAAFFITRATNAHYAERARGQSSYVAYTCLQSVGPIGGLALGVLALQVFEPSAVLLCASYAVANAIGTLFALPRLGMAWGLKRPHRTVLLAAFGFGGPMLGLFVLGWIAENHLRYIVQWQSGAVALGLVSVGWGLGRRCASVAAMLVTTAGFPIASRLLNEGKRDEAITQLGINAALLLAFTFPISAGLTLIGPALVQLAVAPAYREATTAVLGLSVISGTVRLLHVHISDQWHVLERRFVLAAWVDVVEIAACALGTWVGLVHFGLQGAVVGQLLGSAITVGFSQFHASVRHGFRWPWIDTFKISIATAAMSAVLWLAGVAPTPIGIGFGVVIGALVYATMLGLFYIGPLRLRAIGYIRRPRT